MSVKWAWDECEMSIRKALSTYVGISYWNLVTVGAVGARAPTGFQKLQIKKCNKTQNYGVKGNF